MKFRILLGVAILLVMTVGCGKTKTQPTVSTALQQVEDFAAYFVDKASKNQLDSLKNYYPDLEKVDSVTGGLNPDSVRVLETVDPAVFEIVMKPDVKMEVKNVGGVITVTRSFGLFAFDPYKKELAKKTGLWDDLRPDSELADRMADEGFFKYINDFSTIKSSDIIQIGEPDFSRSSNPEIGVQRLTNLTDIPIDAEDYVVTMYKTSGFEGNEAAATYNEAGKPIPPHESVEVEIIRSPREYVKVTGVKFTLTQEELKEKFAPYEGDEYQRYVNGFN